MTKKLTDFNTCLKAYWTILNCLFYNKNLSTIPSLLINGKLVVKKQAILITFFASIDTPIDNTRCLPSFFYGAGSIIKSGKMLPKMRY